MPTVHGNKFATVFLRVKSLFHLFSTSFYETCFPDGVTVARYAGNTTPYRFNKFGSKRNRAFFLISFSINSNKSYIPSSVHDAGSVNIDNNVITFEIKNELLGTDLELSFEYHINCPVKKQVKHSMH